jgi:hypothetical protein
MLYICDQFNVTLEIDIKVRMISYWCKLIQGKQSKLSTIAYKLLYVKKI